MNHSGEAAEQIVRMSLEGVEVAARITGTAAREIAVLLIAALKSESQGSHKLRGKARLSTMLKSGKPLEIFSVRETDLAKFAQGAKQYGIVYCALRDVSKSPDGLCDILVKADDAPKISRVIERFAFGTVDRARLESDITAQEAPDKSPFVSAGPEPPKTALSEPTFGNEKKPDRATTSRPSVKEEIRGITAARKQKEGAMPGPDIRQPDIAIPGPVAAHQPPLPGKTKPAVAKVR